MSEVKVNKITPTANCGTVTLGDSGDTFSLPAGVTLSNAGSITNSGTITNTGTISGGTITGTIDNQVNWDTTAKTAGFTAVAGNGYFVNTTSGAITVTLPATPTAGDLVGIKDYANTADTNNITIDRNGSNIQGTANNFVISTEGLSIILIYVDGTQGWVSTGAAQANNITSPTFIVATGGTVVACGDYKMHVFTGPGTFTVCSLGNPSGGPNNVCYMVVAGGGGGQRASGGGAGGAGGLRTGTGSPVTVTSYPISIGGGGSCSSSTGVAGSNGSNSVFNSITSAGGGGGGAGWTGVGNAPPTEQGKPGGSGGGGGARYSAGGGSGTGPGGTGNTPPVAPPQGNNGGNGNSANSPASILNAGGGGGAASTGGTGNPTAGGAGGNGIDVSPIFGPTQPFYLPGGDAGYFAGGGGGMNSNACTGNPAGGLGGGANGWNSSQGGADTAPANSGGGGGGAQPSGSGGSGIVVIRYKYQ